MSRRDTIFIAVLINVGLLVILFATAQTGKQEIDHPLVQSEKVASPVTETPVVIPPTPDIARRYIAEDEADQVLAELQIDETPVVVATPAVAPAPAPTPAQEETQFVDVTVKKGDSLDKIARANESSVEEIIEVNGLNSTVLQIGQKLRIPLAKKSAIRRRRISTDTAQVGQDFYTIRSGDNPWSIAMKYRIPLDELLALNNLDENTARRLKPGDRIRVK
jgi:peptidoglycan DL-endopeptidase LytF